MSILSAIIQGMIQGFSEFLPISSSGHISVYQYLTGINSETSFMFLIVLHLGTLLAVFIAFWKTIWELIKEFISLIGDIFKKKSRAFYDPTPNRRMIFLFVIACIPMLADIFLRDILESVGMDNNIIGEGICFIISALLLIFAESVVGGKRRAGTQTYKSAIAIGIAQAIAPLPGISRSGATISVGIMSGLDPSYAMTFSFIFGIPAILGSLYIEFKDILAAAETISYTTTAIGLVCSTLFGLLAIKIMSGAVKNKKLKFFAYYLLIIGTLCIVLGYIDISNNYVIRNFIKAFFKL